MKVKILKKIRKYFDYQFDENKNIVLRRKADGQIRIYETINDMFFRLYMHGSMFPDRLYVIWSRNKKDRRNKSLWNRLTANKFKTP